eukprot:8060540-Pyramimonas_sp.AAC.1
MALVIYRESGAAADQSLPTRSFQLPHEVSVSLRQEKKDEWGKDTNLGKLPREGNGITLQIMNLFCASTHTSGLASCPPFIEEISAVGSRADLPCDSVFDFPFDEHICAHRAI